MHLFLAFFSFILAQVPLATSAQERNKPIVFQPEFVWEDGSKTELGTGCFIKTANGEIVGLTSAHFINFTGPRLMEARWLDVRTKKIVARSETSWGRPGREGSYYPLDLRSDYLLFLMTGDLDSQNILELDHRDCIKAGERVFFPNKSVTCCSDYEWVEGTINKAECCYLIIQLDTKINLHALSGTPVLSQVTGKVIGILTGGDIEGENTILYLAPIKDVRQKLLLTQPCYPLKSVIGMLN